MQTVLSTIGINANLVGGGVLVSRATQRVLIIRARAEAFPFDESIVRECDHLLIVDHANIWKVTLLRCPQLTTKAESVFPHRVLVSVLKALLSESQGDSIPDVCTIECVFSKQMDWGINIIRHDVFGTLSTFGVGKRIIDGAATSEDFPVFAKRLAVTMSLLAKQAVDCSFIPPERHSFPYSMSLLRRITTILESPVIDATDLKNVLDELRSCLQNA